MALDITITFLDGARKDDVQSFTLLPLKLGRSQHSDIVFEASEVSGEHAHFVQGADGGLEVHDKQSRNGVLVDGVTVSGVAAVPNPGVVQLGPNGPRIRVTYEEGGGVSFGRLRRKTDRMNKTPEQLAATSDAVQTYNPADLGLEPRKKQPRELTGAVVGLILGVAVLGLAGLAYALFAR